jgi:hypothetical protein
MKADRASAEATCQVQGGHLAAYTSLAEQIEVEQVRRHLSSLSQPELQCGALPSRAAAASASRVTPVARCTPPQYYISSGYMFPTYTLHYWIGLRSNRTDWPLFDWNNMVFLPPKRFRDRCGPEGLGLGLGLG